MIVFAIESSCDETAAAVLNCEDNELRVLSSVVSSQIPIHALYGGVVPEIASRAHCEAITNISRQAIDESGISLSDIDVVAVTYAPGLIGSLLVGVSFAKSFAATLGVPLVPVNHIKAHVSASFVENSNLKPPFLSLVVSGGHTSLYQVSDYITYDEIGGTRDDACGEAFDKVGRVMGLPYPGGAAMDKLASEAFETIDYTQKTSLSFPSPAVNDDSLDYSFSGLKTAVINHIHNEKQKMKSDDIPHETKKLIAGAFTKAVCEGVCKKLDIALKTTNTHTLVMAGGVAANSHLRSAVKKVCEDNGVRFIVPSIAYCGDNAVMVGAAGYHMYKMGIKADSSLNAYASDESADEYFDSLINKLKI